MHSTPVQHPCAQAVLCSSCVHAGIAIDKTQGAGTDIRCENAIFVLTTNVLDEDILEYCSKHPDILATRELGPLKLAKRIKDLEGIMKANLKKAFGVSSQLGFVSTQN
jgi:hypothetical protein